MDSLFASEGVRLALSGSAAPDFRELQNQGKIVLVNCAGSTSTRGVRLLLQGLPAEDQRVRVWNKEVYGSGAEEHATFEGGKFIDESGTDTDLTAAVTHWQPLPQPPKKEDE